MGILSSMNTGISGLKTLGESLSITADNIANSNTTGFKTSRAEFGDIIARSLKGILGGNQIGRGVKLNAVTPVFSQGSISQTDRSTDLALQGDGFFVVDGEEGRAYTRNGAFQFDNEGKLRNADGYLVQGFIADEDGKVTNKLGNVSINRTIIDAKGTGNVKINMNLDMRAPIKQWDPQDPDKSSNYNTGVVVYDSAGNSHLVTMYFNKVSDGEWEWHSMVKGEEVPGGEKGTMVEEASGKMKFDVYGKLQSQEVSDGTFTFSNGAIPDQQVKFDFGDDIETGGTGIMGATQYGSESDAFKIIQDGYTAGTLSGLSFNDDGVLSAVFTNGEVVDVAQIAVAKFENNEGLFKLGRNLFRESRKSGQPNVGKPNQAGRGKVFSKSLEESTTDIATEFVDIIKTQRAFQANSRTVVTSDELIQEVLNWKRL